MYRQTAASKPAATTSGPSSAAGKQQTLSSTSESSPTTIREIRSRAVGASNNSNAARHLLVSRRQATSMERLNSGSGSVVSSLHNSNDREKSSPSSGSSNSLNTSASASPLRGGTSGGLNRTASRVSRFRSAKAVFERLSSTNNSGSAGKLDKPSATEKPRGTVASRYAAAAAARATSHANATSSSGTTATTSPRSRLPTNSLARSQDSASRSSSNLDLHKSANNSSGNSPRIEASLPKPQPRVIASRTSTQTTSSSNSGSNGPRTRSTTGVSSLPTKATPTTAPPPATATARPPPKDLIDEIVLEIARDVEKQEPDPNCTIQDLSNCDVSGIPETLDFDRCFQDVEMMTEDEARKLLSRKSSTPASSTAKVGLSTLTDPSTLDPVREDPSDQKDLTNECENTENQLIPLEPSKSINLSTNPSDSTPKEKIVAATATETPATNSKCKVRFSEEPVAIFSTHAVEDYDRRNDDIDPIAASAEYEIEKSKEREGIREDSDSEEPALNNEFGAVKTSDYFNQLSPQEAQQQDLLVNNLGNPHGAANSAANSSPLPPLLPGGDSSDQKSDDDEELASKKEYMESLEREVSLKRILEQNLRDLQSQYYEAVKELDEYKGVAETKIADLEQSISNLNSKLEGSQNELTDVREQSNGLDKQLNDIKEFSQTLEKKYHRAKRIIKDMQSREQSFNRREQLYQQKLDEIEHELGVLIDSVDRTIYDDGLKFYSMTDANSCQRVHQAQLDVFGLIRQMLNNFNANQSTQNPQIKQRVVSILEQQLANLMVLTNGTTAVAGNVNPVPPLGIVSGNKTINDNLSSAPMGADDLSNKSHSQTNPSYQLASHRLSQPNLPHPIGVGGQPTKLFHGLNPVVPIPTVSNTVLPNEPSPPQSVNSYPSSNSLNSLNNNNNNHSTNNNNNNNIIIASKIRNQPSISDLQMNIQSTLSSASTNPISGGEDKFQPAPDIQVPYQTNEWHDKPVSEWTTTQVSTWLLALGLDQYISKFEDRNVNGQSLINLDSTVLKGLGVLNSNDRNLLKKKIRELRVEMEKERKLIEKKMKENLKDKSKSKLNGNNRNENTKNDAQQNKPSWKRGLLS